MKLLLFACVAFWLIWYHTRTPTHRTDVELLLCDNISIFQGWYYILYMVKVCVALLKQKSQGLKL